MNFLPEKLPGIDIPFALTNLSGNEKKLGRLILKFHAEFSDASDRIRETIDNPDPEAGARLAHTLKGVAGSIGALSLMKSAKELESSIRKKDREKSERNFEALENALEKVFESVNILKETFHTKDFPGTNHPPEMAPETVDRKWAGFLAKRIEKALEADALLDDELFADFRKALPDAGYREKLDRLEECIEKIEYDKALKILAGITGLFDP